MNTSLYYQEHSSDKVYNVAVVLTDTVNNLYSVNFSYGRRGSSLNTGTKTPSPIGYSDAISVFNKLVKEKIAKGYKESGNTQSSVSALVASRDTGYRPQLLNECTEDDVSEYLNNDDWCAQEKFDGENRLLIAAGNVSFGANRKGLQIPLSEKILNELKKLPLGLVFSGEDLGDKVVIFDQINENVKNEPYHERSNELILNLTPPYANTDTSILSPIYTAWTTRDKHALYQELLARNAEGIVFKNIHAIYQPGRPNSGGDQLKNKFYETASCIVSGINPYKRSIQISLYDETGKLIKVGNATIYPNQKIPALNSVVEIKYLYAYLGGSLYQPVFLKERNDINPEECLSSKLKYKPVNEQV